MKKEIEKQIIPTYIENRLASYSFGMKFCPAVIKDGEGYQLRVIMSGGYGKTNYDYFECDKDGLVIKSPRGMAKEFNKRVRFAKLDELVEEYKKKRVNQF